MLILLAYIVAGLLAGAVLYSLGRRRWYWHAAAVVAAVLIGSLRPLSGPAGNGYYLVTGSLFLFLLVWGAGAPLMRALGIPARWRTRIADSAG